MNGKTLLVGASNAVYSFVKHDGAWVEKQKLTAPESNFGASLSLSGNTAVVGTSGAAYVFIRVGDDRVEQQRLLPSAPDQGFAAGVAVFGDTLLVGAPSDVLDSDNFGSVYVFLRNGSTWTEQTRLRAGQNLDGEAASVAR